MDPLNVWFVLLEDIQIGVEVNCNVIFYFPRIATDITDVWTA